VHNTSTTNPFVHVILAVWQAVGSDNCLRAVYSFCLQH